MVMNAMQEEATVLGQNQWVLPSILDSVAKKASRTAAVAMPPFVNRLQTAKENVKNHHLEKDTIQALTAISMHSV